MTKDEALSLALEALEDACGNRCNAEYNPCFQQDAITAIKAALETKDEPVGWAEHGVINWLADKQFNHTSFLYATPSQRTWVGLMDEEIDVIYEQHHNQYGECESVGLGYERAIEAKLKEKNT